MKTLFAILLGFIAFSLKAQDSHPVDSIFVGKITIDKMNRTRIFLTGFNQKVDSSGIYTTTYFFGNKINRPEFDVNIDMQFESKLIPFGPAGFEYGPQGSGRFSGRGNLMGSQKHLYLQGQMTAGSRHFFIRIKSKDKPVPTITGIDGQANF